MTNINNEQEYEVAIKRIEELLKLVDNDTPPTDKNYIELDFISNLVVDYEEEHIDPSFKN
jgi:HTH-type transcriptional regulator / antitoxin HigA